MGVSKTAIGVMVLLAALLAGFGLWQFGGLGLAGGEHEREHAERGYGYDEDDYEEDEEHEDDD